MSEDCQGIDRPVITAREMLKQEDGCEPMHSWTI